MVQRWVGAALALTVLLLTLSSCGVSVAGTEAPAPPTGADTLILQTRYHPGMGSALSQWELPGLSVYGDGRAIVADRLDGDSGPVMTAREYHLTPQALRELFRLAHQADLFQDRSFDDPDVSDAAGASILIRSDRLWRTSVTLASEPRRGPRKQVLDFSRSLDLTTWSPSAFSSPMVRYQPTRTALILTGGASGPTRPWPLRRPAAEFPGYPQTTCAVLTPAQLTDVTRRIGTGTSWSTGGLDHVRISLRPLLPDELTAPCTHLIR